MLQELLFRYSLRQLMEMVFCRLLLCVMQYMLFQLLKQGKQMRKLQTIEQQDYQLQIYEE